MMAQAAALSLSHEPIFRRLVAVSVALHVGTLAGFLFTPPWLRRPLRPQPVMVMLQAALPAAPTKAPEPVPAPPPPKPPEEKPPEPEPTPEPPKQEVDEAIVIPPVPREKPRDRVKPPEQKPPEKPPEKKPEKKPETRVSAADLMKQIRDRVGEEPAPTEGPSGGPGDVDPELAAYEQRLYTCFFSNWIGVQRYRRRRDLQVEFKVRVTPDGGVISVDKVRASGEPILDDAAERAIRRCAPGNRLPAPPKGHTDLTFTFSPQET